MKKLFLTLLAVLLFVSCDDNNKRDTPLNVEFTFWQATSITPPSSKQISYLKLYDTTFDLLSERYVEDELVETTIISGTFSYRRPKIILQNSTSSIQGIITGRTMLLSNQLIFERQEIDAF